MGGEDSAAGVVTVFREMKLEREACSGPPKAGEGE